MVAVQYVYNYIPRSEFRPRDLDGAQTSEGRGFNAAHVLLPLLAQLFLYFESAQWSLLIGKLRR